MKYSIIIFLFLYFTTQETSAQDFNFKIDSEKPVFQVAFPAEPVRKDLDKNGQNAIQYNALHKKTAYSFSVQTIPDSIEDKQYIRNSIHVAFKQTMNVIQHYDITLNEKISGICYEGISKKDNTLSRFHVYFHKNFVFYIALARANKMPSKKLMEKFLKTVYIE